MCNALYAQQILQPPTRPLPVLIFLTQKKICNFYFFHILLSWENVISGAHTNYRLPNQQKCEICDQILCVLRFSLLYSYCEICCHCVRESESVQERREREAKFSFERSQTDPIITGPRFVLLLLLLLYIIVVWAWACSTLARMGLNTLVRMGLNKTIFK